MQSRHKETRAAAIVLAQPLRGARCIVRSGYDHGLQRGTQDAFDGTFPFRLYVKSVSEGADEMKITRRIARGKAIARQTNNKRVVDRAPSNFPGDVWCESLHRDSRVNSASVSLTASCPCTTAWTAVSRSALSCASVCGLRRPLLQTVLTQQRAQRVELRCSRPREQVLQLGSQAVQSCLPVAGQSRASARRLPCVQQFGAHSRSQSRQFRRARAWPHVLLQQFAGRAAVASASLRSVTSCS